MILSVLGKYPYITSDELVDNIRARTKNGYSESHIKKTLASIKNEKAKKFCGSKLVDHHSEVGAHSKQKLFLTKEGQKRYEDLLQLNFQSDGDHNSLILEWMNPYLELDYHEKTDKILDEDCIVINNTTSKAIVLIVMNSVDTSEEATQLANRLTTINEQLKKSYVVEFDLKLRNINTRFREVALKQLNEHFIVRLSSY